MAMRHYPDPQGRALAVLQGSHPRLGPDSPFQQLDPEVLDIIGHMAHPIAERPISGRYLHGDGNDSLRQSSQGINPSPYLFTVLYRGKPVLHRPIMEPVDEKDYTTITYTSWLFGCTERVGFRVTLTPIHRCKYQHVAKITELHYRGQDPFVKQQCYCDSEEEMLAFQARNELGFELILTNPANIHSKPWTPIVV